MKPIEKKTWDRISLNKKVSLRRWVNWPQEKPLDKFIKDILEPQVDESYYLSEERAQKLLASTRHTSALQDKEYAYACAARDWKEPKCIQLNNPLHSNDRVYAQEGVSPTLNTMQGGDRQPFIVASRGRNPANPSDRTTGAPTEQRLEPNLDGVSNTITSVEKDNYVMQDVLIRKLTPKECFRLMGFFKDEIRLEGLSKTQQYKLAGNGWDVNLVSQILPGLVRK